MDHFHNRLEAMNESKLSAEQKAGLNVTLVKLCEMIYRKMKLLN